MIEYNQNDNEDNHTVHNIANNSTDARTMSIYNL